MRLHRPQRAFNSRGGAFAQNARLRPPLGETSFAVFPQTPFLELFPLQEKNRRVLPKLRLTTTQGDSHE